jgi:hypothetical protein
MILMPVVLMRVACVFVAAGAAIPAHLMLKT